MPHDFIKHHSLTYYNMEER